ncbi:MAG: motility-associated protein [Pseudomonadota bacterium]
MFQIIGFFVVCVLVGIGLVATGAEGVLAALPFELSLIGGAALGTLMIGNSGEVTRAALIGLYQAVRGSRWQAQDYASLLGVMGELSRRIRRGGYISIEDDLEDPVASKLFQSAKQLQYDRAALDLICDALRLCALDPSNPQRALEQMDRSIEQSVARRMRSVGALQTVADALPALGIVAAVLGIIKTMTAIDAPSAAVGAMVASALLGTFLGVFLSYGLVGPLANRFGQVVEEESTALDVIRTFLVQYISGASPQAASDVARACIPKHAQPNLESLEIASERVRFSAAANAA